MSRIANQYRQMIPLALNLLTESLNGALDRLTFGHGGDLDSLMPDTVSKTKLIAIFLPYAMQEAANKLGIKYKFVNANGYDVEMSDDGVVTIEEKASLMSEDTSASFATGNNHSKVKNHLHFVMKLQNVGNIFTSCFAALVDVPNLSEGSGWDDAVTKSGKNNNGFSSLKVLNQDYDKIEVIYGKIRNAKKYIHTEYEILNA